MPFYRAWFLSRFYAREENVEDQCKGVGSGEGGSRGAMAPHYFDVGGQGGREGHGSHYLTQQL